MPQPGNWKWNKQMLRVTLEMISVTKRTNTSKGKHII